MTASIWYRISWKSAGKISDEALTIAAVSQYV